MIVTQVCAAIIIEDLKYWMDLLPCRWLKTAVTVAQNLREDGSLSPEYAVSHLHVSHCTAEVILICS